MEKDCLTSGLSGLNPTLLRPLLRCARRKITSSAHSAASLGLNMHMIKIINIIYILLLLLSGCRKEINIVSTPKNPITHEEYKIYASIINELTKSYKKKYNPYIYDSTLVMKNSTSYYYEGTKKILKYSMPGPGKSFDILEPKAKLIWPDLDIEFYQYILDTINTKSYPLFTDSINSIIPVQIWRNNSLSTINIRNGEALLVWFSRIAFNKNINECIVYYEYCCGSLCGAGNWYWMKKLNNSWIKYKKLGIWVS
jgi:hypothetical protein